MIASRVALIGLAGVLASLGHDVLALVAVLAILFTPAILPRDRSEGS